MHGENPKTLNWTWNFWFLASLKGETWVRIYNIDSMLKDGRLVLIKDN